MCYHAMMFCWALSEKHWIFTPFSWLGDRLEDFGLDRGYIVVKLKIVEECLKARQELENGGQMLQVQIERHKKEEV